MKAEFKTGDVVYYIHEPTDYDDVKKQFWWKVVELNRRGVEVTLWSTHITRTGAWKVAIGITYEFRLGNIALVPEMIVLALSEERTFLE